MQSQDFYPTDRSVEYINTLNGGGRGPHWKLDYSLEMSLKSKQHV